MSDSDLFFRWKDPEVQYMCHKQTSIRLPILIAAQIEALAVMFPGQSKTKIINDLLSQALDEIEPSLPQKKGKKIRETKDGQPIFEDIGPRGRFFELVSEHIARLEAEANLDKGSVPWPEKSFVFGDE